MTVPFVDPETGAELAAADGWLIGEGGKKFPIIGGIPRFCEPDNYSDSFGRQWNLFDKTQLDGEGARDESARRLFAETAWSPASLEGIDLLEVGSGAGRFSRAIL